MEPLTDTEAALLYHVQMYGSDGYPISKLKGPKWLIGPYRDWQGFPIVFKTKRAAFERFELWITLALERWAEFKRYNPNAMLTAVGIK